MTKNIIKKILIISGAGIAEIPLIKSAKNLGLFVITTGINTDAIGHNFSDQYIYGDYSNKQEMLHIVDKYQIDYILPGCNDFAILSASYIHDKRQIGIFDSLETSQTIHHKDRFRNFCYLQHISAPLAIRLSKEEFTLKHFSLSKHIQKLHFPLIVKPIDLASGVGIQKVEDLKYLQKAIENAFQVSRESYIVIEEYIYGEHYSASLLIQNKKIIFQFFAQEYFNQGEFNVAGAFSTTELSSDTQQHLLKDIQKLINKLNLKDGLLHIQFIVRESYPYILEVTRRSPGDLYLLLVNHSVSIDYAELIIKSHCGIKIDLPQHITTKPIVRECITAQKTGNTYTITLKKTPYYSHIETIFFKKKHIEKIGEKLAIVFLEFSDFSKLFQCIPSQRNTIFKVTIK